MLQVYAIIEKETNTVHHVVAKSFRKAVDIASSHQGILPSVKNYEIYDPEIHGDMNGKHLCCTSIYHAGLKE